ncbi:DNA mismatch repair protein MutS [Candidatus Hydrogenosomobacter endosymbioticus]|uniref:DNA mismatch repair protein MutS n=1 Tax=Candidatus Hydrogenosomobacter endosymbioticus TaxID=2558174 RepID=A0ABN6L4J6_9PROT|nr:DNA mismatch repair protein MutS [Candidatus Hydrogenosomobacter endosymbioticus]BDB96537.1 DNA mismatch repair protein MutS [Candidatus Hydrogenosomobacter endosymbioticus]
MMTQYLAVKKEHQDCLVFFRMGDFYELFFEDAITASKELDIVLTSRGKTEKDNIPMCGVPHHASENYISRLVKKGFKIAICDQTESAENKSSKLVKREVTRIVTPGTLLEDNLLESKGYNFLMAICDEADSGSFGIAFIDISIGDFFTEAKNIEQLFSAIHKIQPKEILVPERILRNDQISKIIREWKVNPMPDSRFSLRSSMERMKSFFEVTTLKGIADFSESEVCAAGALIDYVLLTQKKELLSLSRPKKLCESEFLEIDPFTRKNLEIFQTMRGEKNGTLISTIDRTSTPMGARLLLMRLMHPLKNALDISERLESVRFFKQHDATRNNLISILKKIPDIERSLSRLLLDRGGPKDLGAVKSALCLLPSIKMIFASHKECWSIPNEISDAISNINSDLGEFSHKLSTAINDELPAFLRDGGVIARGYCEELDELYDTHFKSSELIQRLQEKYAQETKIPNLKIKRNNIIGYYIEVSPSLSSKIPFSFVLRQSLVSGMRYSTQELIEIEQKLNVAYSEAIQLETSIFNGFIEDLRSLTEKIRKIISSLAILDISSAFALLAEENCYTEPVINDSDDFEIIGGRHPVVEQAYKNSYESDFTKNDCDLSKKKLWLITGPNMAGKSTFLRQNALIVLMAHIGCFVPADRAKIGVVDHLFSRVGASDDISRGHSTFMVEMIETATIVNHATSKSFVILDEIGRGTATYDGLSLAWSCVEHFALSAKCRTLFATHYHELTELQEIENIACYTLSVREWDDKIVFFHEIIPGSADRSYGLHVARLAGIPTNIIHRAQQVLDRFENRL